ncbi:hypothetical protein EON67_07800 [archaeon]|nr:MAG: hypothetical protein EON67_07800 [archaeon]
MIHRVGVGASVAFSVLAVLSYFMLGKGVSFGRQIVSRPSFVPPSLTHSRSLESSGGVTVSPKAEPAAADEQRRMKTA